MSDRLNLDEFAADQARLYQEGLAAIRDEMDERTETYEMFDKAVKATSEAIDRGSVEWELKSEDDRDISDSTPEWE